MKQTGASAADVQADIRQRIAAGEYRPGDKLPRLQELIDTYGIRSRGTMDRVLRGLVSEGLLTVVQGSGIYVRQRKAVTRDLVANVRADYRDAVTGKIREGGQFEAKTGEAADVEVSYEWIDAPERVASALGVEPGQALLARTFRYIVKGEPYQVARSYMIAELAARAGLTSQADERPGVNTFMILRSAGAGIDHASVSLEVRMPTPEETGQLAIPPGTPVIEHWGATSGDGKVVEVSTAVVRGDRVRYVFNVDLAEGSE